MTTIIYHNDKLIGDSRRYESVEKNFTVNYKQKIFLHSSKQFAYGICGDFLPYDHNEFASVIAEFVFDILSGKKIEKNFPYEDIFILVMTRTKTFTIYNQKTVADNCLEKQITFHHSDTVVGYGSGAHCATMAITMGCSIEEAMAEAVMEDVGTGGDIYGVKRKDLFQYNVNHKEG